MIDIKYNNTYELLSHQAKRYKNRIFAIFPKENDQLSYMELYEKSVVFSKYLYFKGVRKGSRVSVIIDKSKDFLIVCTAILNLGAIFHPNDVNMVEDDAIKNFEAFQSEFIICGHEFEEYANFILNKINFKPNFFSINLKYIDKEIKNFNNFDEKLFSLTSKKDPALCIFTSGTTGDPKGVVSSHENILFGGLCLKTSHNIGEKDRVLSVTPLSGTNGFIFSIWSPLATGGSVVYYQEMFTTYRAFEIMSQHRVTWFNGTPTHYTIMVNMPDDISKINLENLRFMRSASAPLPLSIQERFEKMYGLPIIETMGLSEMTGQVFSNPMNTRLRKKMSVGFPINTDFKIIDETGQKLPPNKKGELLVKNKGLMIGYFNDEESTKKAIKNGWLYTRDIASVDDDGYVFIKGRKKNIIIVGGKNISPREIEEVLYSNKKVAEATVFGVPDDLSGEKVVAFVKPNKNKNLTIKEIRNYCSNNLTDYKCPKVIKFCKSLPKGGQGKILRSKVKKEYLKRD